MVRHLNSGLQFSARVLAIDEIGLQFIHVQLEAMTWSGAQLAEAGLLRSRRS